MITHRFLTYSEIKDNDIHKGVSIDIEGLTSEDIQEAIKRQKWLKSKEIKLSEEDLIEIENLKNWKGNFKNKNIKKENTN